MGPRALLNISQISTNPFSDGFPPGIFKFLYPRFPWPSCQKATEQAAAA